MRRAEVVRVARVVAGRALHDGAGMGLGDGDQAREPVRGRAAVVVGEGDEGAARQPPPEVALERRAGARARHRTVAQAALGGQRVGVEHAGGRGLVVGVDDDELPALGREGLRRERVEQDREAARPLVRRHHDADVRGPRRRHGGESMLRPVRVLAVGNMYPPHHFGGYELVWRAAMQHLERPGTRPACSRPT